MEKYDVLVVGGGIAGSVAARFSAKHSLKTLLIEKFKTPRNKPCSGIWGAPVFSTTYNERLPAFSTGCLTPFIWFFS